MQVAPAGWARLQLTTDSCSTGAASRSKGRPAHHSVGTPINPAHLVHPLLQVRKLPSPLPACNLQALDGALPLCLPRLLLQLPPPPVLLPVTLALHPSAVQRLTQLSWQPWHCSSDSRAEVA